MHTHKRTPTYTHICTHKHWMRNAKYRYCKTKIKSFAIILFVENLIGLSIGRSGNDLTFGCFSFVQFDCLLQHFPTFACACFISFISIRLEMFQLHLMNYVYVYHRNCKTYKFVYWFFFQYTLLLHSRSI